MERPERLHSGGFDDFLKQVEPKLKRVLATYRVPSEDAEDLLQQTLLALVYQWERVRDPEAWLMGTLKRHCLMHLRTLRRRIYSSMDTAFLELLSQPPESPQERADLLLDLQNLIEKLSPRCQSLLRLRFRLGYEAPEVARKMGYRESSIGKITTRCLAALSRVMLAAGLVDPSAAGTAVRDVRPVARR